MPICSNCKEQMSNNLFDAGRSFPAYSLTAGLAGTAGALLGGPILLIPAAIVTGVVADTLSRNCERCGNEMADDEESYHIMEEITDQLGSHSYRPVSRPSNQGSQPASQQYSQPFRHEESAQNKTVADPGSFRKEFPAEDLKPQPEFVFDDAEGRFVPKDIPTGEIDTITDSIAPMNPLGDEQFAIQDNIEDLGTDIFQETGIDDLINDDSLGPQDDLLI